MLFKSFFLAFIVSSVFCRKVKVGLVEHREANGDEHEFITVDLKKKDGSEDIKLMVQLRIHLINDQVHVNGFPLKHGIVHAVHMKVTLIEIENGMEKPARLGLIHVRVFVLEGTNKDGSKKLTVEEEFVKVDGHEVIQVDVKQVVWESLVKEPVTTTIRLKDSKIHALKRDNDHHMYCNHHPRLPEHALSAGKDQYEVYEEYYHPSHCGHSVKCWYKRLSLKSKICLFSAGFLVLISLMICCSICAKKRRNQRTLEISAPIDDSVVVDNDEKKLGGKSSKAYDFHFELDNTVVVDNDKKSLIEN